MCHGLVGRTLRRHLLALTALVAFAACMMGAPGVARASSEAYQIYPKPHTVTYANGEQTLRSRAVVVVEDGVDADASRRLDEALTLKGMTAERAKEVPTSRGTTAVLVGVKDSGGAVDAQVKRLVEEGRLTYPEDLFSKTDAYLLASLPAEAAGPDQLIVLGRDTDAAYYGLTTLFQVLQQTEGARLRAFTVADWADVVTRGFIEGYYGDPWSTADRVNLMTWGGYYKLNAYFYAPKDDPKHNAKWRELYTPTELAEKIEPLAKAGNESKCRFVFALHPFMKDPITSANYDESTGVLKQKFLQVMDHGVRQIAILADDQRNTTDPALFKRLLGDMTNWLHEQQRAVGADGALKYPGLKDTLIFCPVNYMGNGEGWYKELPENVQVINTGGRVWGKIDKRFAETFTRTAGVAPFMWINWPCSDNDKDALHMGGHNEFLGSDLTPGQVKGVVLNPMQQSEPSKQGIFMNADFTWNLWESTDRANETWMRSFSYIDHNGPQDTEGSRALRELSGHTKRMLGGGVVWENAESADIKDKLAAFRAKLGAGTVNEAGCDEMAKIFTALQNNAKTFRAHAGTPAMLKQMEPWMDTWDDLTEAALAYLAALKADISGDTSTLLAQYAAGAGAFERAGGHGFHYVNHTEYARVGKAHITPFVVELATQVGERATLAADPDANVKKFITSRTDAPAGSVDSLLDGNPRTGVSYKEPASVSAGTYAGFEQTRPFDLARFTVTYDASHPNDTIQNAKLQVLRKPDGKGAGTWEDVAGKTISGNRDAVVDFDGLNERGVYGVRLMATADNAAQCWLTINEVEVNKAAASANTFEVMTGSVSIEGQQNADTSRALGNVSDNNTATEAWFKKGGTGAERDHTMAGAAVVVTFDGTKVIDAIEFEQGVSKASDVIASGDVLYQDENGSWVDAGDITNAVKQRVELSGEVRTKAIKVVNKVETQGWWLVGELHATHGQTADQKLGAPSITTNMGTHQEHVPSRAADGDESTKFWSNAVTAPGKYLMCSFGGAKTIDTVHMLQGSQDAFAAADVFYTDDATPRADAGTWKKLGSFGSASDQSLEFEPVRATAIKVQATAATNNWLQVFELEAYERYAYQTDNIFSTVKDLGELRARVARGTATVAGKPIALTTVGDVAAVDLGSVRREVTVHTAPAGVAGAHIELVSSHNALEWTPVGNTPVEARYIGYRATAQNVALDVNGMQVAFLDSLAPRVVKSELPGAQTLDAARIFDGDVRTATKSSGGPAAGNVIVFDLGQERDITSLEYFVPETSVDHIRNAVVEVADSLDAAATWTPVLDINSTTIVPDGQGWDVTAKDCGWLAHSSTYPGNMMVASAPGAKASGRYLRIRFTGTYQQRWVEIGELRINGGVYASTYAEADVVSSVIEQPNLLPGHMLDKNLGTVWAPQANASGGSMTYRVSAPLKADGTPMQGIRIVSNGAPSGATVKATLYVDDAYRATEEVELGTLDQVSQEFRFGTPRTRSVVDFTAVKDVTISWTAGAEPRIAELYLLASAPRAEAGSVDQLRELVTRASALATQGWTADSQQALADAIAKANRAVASASTQTPEALAAMTAQLQRAMNGVERYAGAELGELVAHAQADEANYTSASWALYRDALAAAREALTHPDNVARTTGEQLVRDLTAAREGLAFNAISHDRAAQMTIDTDALFGGGVYTAQSGKAFEEALAALKQLVDRGEKAADVLRPAMDALVGAQQSLVDVAALAAERTEFEATDARAYTAESFAAYRQAYEDTNAAMERGTAQQVMAATQALQAAQAGLKVLDMQALLKECGALVEQDYTEASWQVFSRALQAAQAGAQSPEAPVLAQALSDARAALVNVAALRGAIARGSDVDGRRFTSESMSLLTAALDAAKARLVDGSAEEVEQARQAVLAALASLVPQAEQGSANPGLPGGSESGGSVEGGSASAAADAGEAGAAPEAGGMPKAGEATKADKATSMQSGSRQAVSALPTTGDDALGLMLVTGLLGMATCGAAVFVRRRFH